MTSPVAGAPSARRPDDSPPEAGRGIGAPAQVREGGPVDHSSDAHAGPSAQVADGARYVNRELSWLAFNERVLAQATGPGHPLLERVRFLSISAGNLDEFYMVRVAGLRGQQAAGVKVPSLDGLTPAEQLDEIHRRADALMRDQHLCWAALLPELRQQGIAVIEPAGA